MGMLLLRRVRLPGRAHFRIPGEQLFAGVSFHDAFIDEFDQIETLHLGKKLHKDVPRESLAISAA